MSTTFCQHPDCNITLTKNQKLYCSKSCATKINNSGLRRHGKPNNICPVCGTMTKRSTTKYCSSKCFSSTKKHTKEQLKASNAENQARYRAKGYRTLAPGANKEIIKEFYKNCPEGYEVDHIVPLSKGGLHHEDNLQYLTVLENRKKNNRLS